VLTRSAARRWHALPDLTEWPRERSYENSASVPTTSTHKLQRRGGGRRIGIIRHNGPLSTKQLRRIILSTVAAGRTHVVHGSPSVGLRRWTREVHVAVPQAVTGEGCSVLQRRSYSISSDWSRFEVKHGSTSAPLSTALVTAARRSPRRDQGAALGSAVQQRLVEAPDLRNA